MRAGNYMTIENAETTQEPYIETHNHMYSGIVYPTKTTEPTIGKLGVGGFHDTQTRHTRSQYARNRYPFINERESIGYYTRSILQTLDSGSIEFSVYLPLLVLVVLMFLQK